MGFNTLKQVLSYLDQIPRFKESGPEGARFNLQLLRQFCRRLGHPPDRLNVIHVAGTNGKGTTCRYLGSVYGCAGYRCGVFISPHLMDFRERFTINGRWISEEAIRTFFNRYQSDLERHRLTYFEICTALAFWWFEREGVDLAVMETGLGGRLDATNIVDQPLASVITNIGTDHQELLGESIEEISREKAGIIKRNRPVVLGNVGDRANAVIRQIAREKNSSVHESEALGPAFRSGKFILHTPDAVELTSGYASPVNAFNIATTWKVTEVLQSDFPCPLSAFRDGIKQVARLYPRTGCFERLHPDYNWYFDGAHNLEALQALKKGLEYYRPIEEWILVFTLMRDKIGPSVLNAFSDFKKKYYYSLEMKRAATFEEVDKHMRCLLPFPADNKSAESTLLDQFQSEFVIFTGSLYFYEKVRKWMDACSTE